MPAKAKHERGFRYHCDYCRADITTEISIKCAHCADFDLCLRCFSMGVELVPHRNSHPYHVVDHVTTPIFDEDWGADEEQLLLEGIEMYGMGNWGDVASHVGTKTKDECEQHYIVVYLSPESVVKKSAGGPDYAPDISKIKRKVKKMTKPKVKLMQSKSAQVGFLIKRDEFETKFDDEAELLVADMEFKDEDTIWERDLKLKILEIYNCKVDARIERKVFVLARGLLEKKQDTSSPAERQAIDSLKVFARFQSPEDHKALIDGLINEIRLRKKIEKLQKYRQNGIHTLAEGAIFDQLSKKRDKPSGHSYEDDTSYRDESGYVPKKRRGAKVEGFRLMNFEGYELLSADERALCKEIRIVPQHFLAIKDRMFYQSYDQGYLKQAQARKMFQIDSKIIDKIHNFFVTVGWVADTLPDHLAMQHFDQSSNMMYRYGQTDQRHARRYQSQYAGYSHGIPVMTGQTADHTEAPQYRASLHDTHATASSPASYSHYGRSATPSTDAASSAQYSHLQQYVQRHRYQIPQHRQHVDSSTQNRATTQRTQAAHRGYAPSYSSAHVSRAQPQAMLYDTSLTTLPYP